MRKVLAGGISGFPEEPSGLGRIMRQSYSGGRGQHAGRNPATRRLFSPMENLGENASINGHREGLAHAHVVERLSIDDKAIVIAPELWHALETGQLGEELFFQNRDAVVVNEIELALFVHGQGGCLLI